MSADLATTLEAREAVIERGMQTFMEVGRALAEIREDRLYREQYETFEDYCRERWGWSRNYVNKQIEASRIVGDLTQLGTTVPTSERQARELSGLEPEQAADVMRDAHERTEGRVTATAIKNARERIAPKPRVTDIISREQVGELNVPTEPELFECDACAGAFAELTRTTAGSLCDRCADLYDATVEFPPLDYYYNLGRTDDVLRLANALRGYNEPERSARVEILRKTIAAEQAGAFDRMESEQPDYRSLADAIFTAANRAAQEIARAGGEDTIARALANANEIAVNNWHSQFHDLAESCSRLAAACRPTLRRIK